MNGKRSDDKAGKADTKAAAGDVETGRVDQPFPVIAIGASAGGLTAFKAFLRALPADSGMAVVAILHLDPTHKSLLAELLGRSSSIPVLEAGHGMPLQPNCVYVIPPNQSLTINNGRLQLQAPSEPRGLRMPIDTFFRSLAKSHGEHAIAVVLSGTGSDGTQGIRDIHEAGGLVLAGTAEDSEFAGMPASAVSTGLVDLELPPAEMMAAIIDYSRRLPTTAEQPQEDDSTDDLSAVLSLLHTRTHFDFRAYKHSTLMRRMRRRMNIAGIDKISSYMQNLRTNDEEIRLLVKDFLIGVTAFFRDPDAYDELERKVLPELLRRQNDGDTVRVWVAGCSTGEEAYSLAILLTEAIEAAGANLTPVIFGTDIDADALVTARKGLYPASVVANLSAERLDRFFDPEGLSYRVTKQLRARVVFAEQNLVVDPPFSKMDLISCRNLLIYYNADLQQRALALMHFGLNDNGFLFLGSSESIKQQTDLFEPISKKWRLFRRLAITGRSRVLIDPLRGSHPKRLGDEVGLPMQLRPALADRVIALLLKRFAPASVLINSAGEILYYHGDTQLVLRQQYGQPTNDLLALARSGLASQLRKVIARALETNRQQIIPELRLDDPERDTLLRITAAPIIWTPRSEKLLLISFEPLATKPAASADADTESDRLKLIDVNNQVADDQQQRIEFQRAITMLESDNLELKVSGQAADERVTTLSEEFQSTTEELETSREELQSLNEELNTVNGQLQEKVSELETVNDDLTNLIRSSNLIVIFLDRQFRIKRFTPASTELFRLIPSDIGRPVTDISHRLQTDNLVDVATTVLEQLVPHDDEVQADNGRWYLRRVSPYRTDDERIDGVVLTLIDIDALKLAETELRQANEQLGEHAEERLSYLLLLRDIALEVNQAADLKAALRAVLARICAEFHWPLAHVFLPGDDNPDTFAATDIWQFRPVDKQHYEAVIDASHLMQVTSSDSDGLLGDALRHRRPRWARGFDNDRKNARARGLPTEDISGHVVIPMLSGNNVVGLLEFFTDGEGSLQILDQQALDAMLQVGTLVGAMATRAQARAEHEQHEAEMAHASRVSTLGELGSSLAHELSQPLAAMSNYIAAAQQAHSNKDSAQLTSLLADINEQVSRTSTIMSSLRDFIGQRSLTRERCDVQQLVQYTLRILSNKIKESAVNIEVNADENLQDIHATAIQIEQVLVNLVVNALNALANLDDANRQIVITLSQHNDRGLHPTVDITVTDNGGGVSAKVEKRLFKALTTTKAYGMGLGLFVSNSIIEAHGGTLQLTQSSAEGSSFTVSLPTIADDVPPANDPVAES